MSVSEQQRTSVNTSVEMRNAGCGTRNGMRVLRGRIHSAFRIPRSAFSAALIVFAAAQLHAQTPIYSLP
ncbi:MAG TPA: hypothetical protein VFO40_13530, partial [Chthoniobacterales bacterium]|nr:hypothetical protein [Chthoniobacterales bacterium]